MAMALRRSASATRPLLQNALRCDAGAAMRALALRQCGFKTLGFLNAERSWPSPDGNANNNQQQPPAGGAPPEGSTSSRDIEGGGTPGAYQSSGSWSSKPGTGKTWPNPNAPRDTPTYTPSSYSSSSKGGGKLWDNPNGLPYWDSKWDDPTKPELRAKGWTWDPNPANSHMGTWPADQPPPNRSPLNFSSPRGGAGGSWDRGPRRDNFNQAAPGGPGGAPGGPGGAPGGPGGAPGGPGGAPGGPGGAPGGPGGAPGGPGGFQGGPGGPGGPVGGGGYQGGGGGGQGGGGGYQGGGGGFQGGPGGGQGGGGFQGGQGGQGGGFPGGPGFQGGR